VKYIVRLNPHAINPITRKVIESRVWEIEQCANKDSEKGIWHCADVRVDSKPVRELFQPPSDGKEPWSLEIFGTCARGHDDVVEIHTTPCDASGN